MRSKLIYFSTCSFLCFTGLSYSGETTPSESVNSNELLLQNVNLNDRDELLDILVKYGNNPDGIPAIQYAAKMGDMRAIELLIKHGADPFTIDHRKYTALYYSVLSGNTQLVNFFLDKGLDPNTMHDCIWWEVWKLKTPQHIQCMEILIVNGLTLVANDPWNYATISCIQQGNLNLLQMVLSKGGTIPCDTINGIDPVVWSIFSDCQENRKDKMECIKWLIQYRILSYKDLEQNSLNADLIANTFPEMLQFLIDNSCLKMDKKLNGIDAYPLHYCLSKPGLVECLIRNGANVNVKGWGGNTALHIAASVTRTSTEFIESLKILLENGADVNAIDEMGRTPFKCSYDSTVKKLLKAYGAVE